MTQVINWNGALQQEGFDILAGKGGMIVSPTKVGYIIMATDTKGLERKFDAKQRKLSKPAVALCGSLEELFELAQLNDKAKELYRKHYEADILLGCILPWSEKGKEKLKAQGIDSLAFDSRATSCFVVKFGVPSENIAKALWEEKGLITFASSANPSGIGNKGKMEGIGERIHNAADLIINGDDYVFSIQPNKDVASRYEQGVMVSLVDENGVLVDDTTENYKPRLIRKGLDCDKIMELMSEVYNSWDYRHGDYY